MIRNNDNLQLSDFINISNTKYLKKQKKQKKGASRSSQSKIPNLNFYFINGRPHIADNSFLNIPTLNEIQAVGRDLQNNIGQKLNQILQNPVRNNDQIMNEINSIRNIQNDIRDRILPDIGQSLERSNAYNEASLVFNSSNPVGKNRDTNLKKAQKEQVIPVLQNLDKYGNMNPYLQELLSRAQKLPNQYSGLPQDAEGEESASSGRVPALSASDNAGQPQRQSQPPPPSEVSAAGAVIGVRPNLDLSTMIRTPARQDADDEEDSNDEDYSNISFSHRNPNRNPIVLSSTPSQNMIRFGGFGGAAGGQLAIPDVSVEDRDGRVLSPRGIFE